ncbi:SEL1-like repeat protein [Beijerinckia indica]|uniref:SEL1-like repeat protein n=1 Tax=Beijerinckia indica TaxID=533 RepID=UPI0011D0F449|nr:SEL1-like repeat protein [Beijerinckia indica]
MEERAQRAWAFAHNRGMIRALENRRDREWEMVASLSCSGEDGFLPFDEWQAVRSDGHGLQSDELRRETTLGADFKTGRGLPEGQASLEGLWSELESELLAFARRRGHAFASSGRVGVDHRQNAAKGPGASSTASAAQSASLSDLRDDVGQLAGQLDAMRQEADRRDSLLRSQAERIGDIGRFRKEISDLTSRLGAFAPLEALRELDREIKAIAQRFEKLGETESDATPILRLRQQLHEIRELITAMASLAENTVRQKPAADLEVLRGTLNDPVRAESLQKIETQIEVLGQRVDTAIAQAETSGQYAALARQIEAVKHQLTARIDANATLSAPHTQQLEQLVRVLADKMDSLPDPRKSEQKFEVLQSELVRIDNRLDQSDKIIASLAAMEMTITRLSAEMGVIKGSLRQSAEAAARQVIEELRQTSSTEPLIPADLENEIEKRFERTEVMIRDGLERLASRLTDLETVTHLARGPVTQAGSLGSLLAPIFAPASEGQGETASVFNISLDKAPGSVREDLDPWRSERVSSVRGSVSAGQKVLPRAETGPVPLQGERRARQENKGPTLVEDELLEPGSGRPLLLRSSGMKKGTFKDRESEAIAGPKARMKQGESVPKGADKLVLPPSREQSTSFDRMIRLLKSARHLVRGRLVLFSLAGLFSLAVLDGLVHAIGSMDQRNNAGHAEQSGPAKTANFVETSPQSSAPAATIPATTQKTSETPAAAKSSINKVGALAFSTREDILRLFRLGEAGHAGAQYHLALLLQEGTAHAEGNDQATDLRAAAFWYGKAADQGLAPAQYRLGLLYEKGFGVDRDLHKATDLYRQAAEQGNTRAMHNLAVLSAESENGPPDYAASVKWFTKAAEYGLRDSQYNCAILLARGLGAPRNLVQAYAWFAIAAAQGDEEAGRKRDEVARHLSTEDYTAGKTIVAAYRPQPSKMAANEVSMPSGDGEQGSRQAEVMKPSLSGL